MHRIHRNKPARALKRTCLATGIVLAFAATAAFAADPAAKAPADNKTAPDKTAAPNAADTAQARKDLEQMREQMREMSRKMADLSAKLGEVGPREYAYRYIGDPDRAMIGVVFSDNDKPRGLRVDAVTPGGPAEKAGLKHGDIVTTIDGKPLAQGDDGAVSWPLHELKVGQELKLGVVREGKNSEIAVKAERREPYNFAFAFGDNDMAKFGELASPEFQHRIQMKVDRAMERAHMAEKSGEMARHAMERFNFSAPWWGLNLASLNADLGGYFGTDRGVLVLSTDDALKTLKSGDVLLEVDGSKVERPEDAFRVLRERPPGSDIKVQVLRQHKPLTLSMKTPEFKGMFVPPPPAPPTPPTPPTPPARAALPALPAPPAPPPPSDRDTA
jgi:C-terminal processing protease CtpA/Prc